MAIEVITKDCSALTDAEMGEMADLSAASEDWGVGTISKQAEEWVLVTLASESGVLSGFVMSTLERIGGTPSLVLGMGCVGRTTSRRGVLRGLMHDQFHKTLMAFPDEDVVVAARIGEPSPMDALVELDTIRPWPGERANGEERAWGRRLAKRFSVTSFNDRTMVGRSDGDRLVFDYESPEPVEAAEPLFAEVGPGSGDLVIAWGWAMAEFLEGFESPASF